MAFNNILPLPSRLSGIEIDYFLLLIIKELLGLRRWRVLPPLAGLPHGEQGWRPPPDLPSPPPIG